MLLAPIAAAMFLPHATRVMHLPTHPPLGSAFAMRKHGAQNSSTMSGFGRHFLNFLLTFPAEMPAEEARKPFNLIIIYRGIRLRRKET